MPKAKKTEKPTSAPTVVAELTVTYGSESQTVRSFDRAWQLALEQARVALPVQVKFNDFVRIDSD